MNTKMQRSHVNRRASRVGAGKGAMGAKSSSSLPVVVVVATSGVVVVVVATGGCVVSEYLFIKYTMNNHHQYSEHKVM